jgi:beta-lactam-binding protein with PASTA domain
VKQYFVGAVVGLAVAAVVAAALLLFTDLRVTDQSPEQEAANLLVGNGQEVVRCCGKPPSVDIPDLTGTSLSDARASLEQLGLRVHLLRPKPGPISSSSPVVNQQPSPGALASPGSKITLVIGSG